MTVAEIVRNARESLRLTPEEFGRKLGVPVEVAAYLESPDTTDDRFLAFLAGALGVSIGELSKSVEKSTISITDTTQKKMDATRASGSLAAQSARFPLFRTFICDTTWCENPVRALESFNTEPFGLAEQNLLLFLLTSALYHFCDTHSSRFGFDRYLFKLHATLFTSFKNALNGDTSVSSGMKEELLTAATGDIFVCDTMENIAIRIIDDFAQELEAKLQGERDDFLEDVGLPFVWRFDDSLKKIVIKENDGTVRAEIRLLDVKKKVAGK